MDYMTRFINLNAKTLKDAIQEIKSSEKSIVTGDCIRTDAGIYTCIDSRHADVIDGYALCATTDCPTVEMDIGPFLSTGCTRQEVLTRTQRMIDVIKTYADSFSVEGGFKENIMENRVNRDTPCYPIICIINGAGGCGKDTFIHAAGMTASVTQISSIKPVKTLANFIIQASEPAAPFSDIAVAAEEDNKTLRYRKLLSDLKRVWTDFCNGPENLMLCSVCDMITNQINGGESYDIIFAVIREPDKIESFRDRVIGSLGLPCITMLIKSWIDPKDFDNDSDAGVEDYPYDLTVINNYGQLDLFKLQAYTFAAVTHRANQSYGIPIEIADTDDDMSDPDTTEECSESVDLDEEPEIDQRHRIPKMKKSKHDDRFNC